MLFSRRGRGRARLLSALTAGAGAADTIDIWRVALESVKPDLDALGARERERVDRLRIDDKRRQFVAAQTALRRILGDYLDIPAGAIEFEYGEHGKPAVSVAPELAFNLTHSKALALVAVGQRTDLGIDVEYLHRDRPFVRLARRYFADGEHRWLTSLPEGEHRGAFYRTWVLKEAYLKAVGTGLSFPPSGFELALESSPPRLVTTQLDGHEPSDWTFDTIDAGRDYVAAICHRGAPRRLIARGPVPG